MEEYSQADARTYIADKFAQQGDFNILPKDIFEKMLDKVMELDEAYMAEAGVNDAGCEAALAASKSKRIGVIGTRATVNSKAYERRILELCPEAKTWGVECPLFVPLIENGFAPDDPITQMTVERYLSEFRDTGVDTIIMGCTHYPFLASTLEKHMPEVTFINVGKALSHGLRTHFDLPGSDRPNHVSYFVSDEDTGFLDIARRYLDAVSADNVQKVNIDQF